MDVATLQNEIRRLLRERNALLVVHYYEREEIRVPAKRALDRMLALS
jgi:quinolinate synthase